MTHAKSDTYAKYLSVFFHVYHVEKILASIQEIQHFDNSSINAHVNSLSLEMSMLISASRLPWIRSVIM